MTAKYGVSDNLRQKFTGYQKDDETGLDFAEARMYENRHGRFTAVDPLLASGKNANPQTFNRYTYVLNSPLVNTDPTGLQTNQEPENETETIDGGTSRACEFFGFACRAMRWVSNTISWNGETARTGSWESATLAVRYRSYTSGGDDSWETDSTPTPIRFGFQQVVNSTTEAQFDALNRTMEDVDAKIQWVPVLSSIYNAQKSGLLAEQGRGSYGRFAVDTVLLGVDVVTAPTGSKGQSAKSIALGLETLGERFVVKELAESTSASVAKNWASNGITRRTVTNNFGRAFNQAASRSDQIYFALDGLIDDIPGALDKGRRFGFDVRRRNVTNAELYTIASNPSLLQKTTFFVNNRRVASPF
ncbi:MAG: RHS repeat-associated core domain-containing protein [Acidobacteria bacterium]|nr:RHS repeat-associated core domain-containing protein [Acidobacteriota bacterium]